MKNNLSTLDHILSKRSKPTSKKLKKVAPQSTPNRDSERNGVNVQENKEEIEKEKCTEINKPSKAGVKHQKKVFIHKTSTDQDPHNVENSLEMEDHNRSDKEPMDGNNMEAMYLSENEFDNRLEEVNTNKNEMDHHPSNSSGNKTAGGSSSVKIKRIIKTMQDDEESGDNQSKFSNKSKLEEAIHHNAKHETELQGNRGGDELISSSRGRLIFDRSIKKESENGENKKRKPIFPFIKRLKPSNGSKFIEI